MQIFLYMLKRVNTRRVAGAAGFMLLLLAGCGPSTENILLVNLVSDLTSGELAVARVELFSDTPEPDQSAPATRWDTIPDQAQLRRGTTRIASYQGLSAGTHAVRVRLLDPLGEMILERIALVEVGGTVTVTLVMTRNCRGVDCPQDGLAPHLAACLDGQCIDPRCTPEQLQYCPESRCDSDTHCPDMRCAVGICRASVCLDIERPDACSTEQWCDPTEGCQPLPETLDGGASFEDAGTGQVDGGRADGGRADGGLLDGGRADGGLLDGGRADGGLLDGGQADGGRADGGQTDGGIGGYAGELVFGAMGDDEIRALAQDATGNLYAVGVFSGTVDFGGGPRSAPAAGTGAFVLALGPDGTYRWDRTYSGSPSQNCSGYGVAVDSGGNLYVGGLFNSRVDFGAGPRDSVGGADGFIVSLDASGVHRWDRQVSGPGSEQIWGLAWGGGRLCGAASFEDGADLGAGAIESHGSADAALICYSEEGSHLHVVPFGSVGQEYPRGIAVDEAGNAYLTGWFAWPIDFGGGERAPVISDAWIASFDPSGAYRWDRVYGGTGIESGVSVATAAGKVVIGGQFSSSTDFGGGERSPTRSDAFVLALDDSGAYLWDWVAHSETAATTRAVCVDDTGRVSAAGGFRGATDFGSGAQAVIGSEDLFVVELGTGGAWFRDRTFGSTGADSASAVLNTSSVNIITAGRYGGTIDFGGGEQANQGRTDGFLLLLQR